MRCAAFSQRQCPDCGALYRFKGSQLIHPQFCLAARFFFKREERRPITALSSELTGLEASLAPKGAGVDILFWRKILEPKRDFSGFSEGFSKRIALALEGRWLEAADEFRGIGAHYFASVALLQVGGIHKDQGLDELAQMGAVQVVNANSASV